MHVELKKRKAGAVEVAAATLIGTAAISILFVYFISNIIPIDVTYKAETIARKYMLKMESRGYLDENNLQDMLKDFKTIGINDVDIAGTTLNKASYGSDIYLIIKYKTTVKKLTVKDGIVPAFSGENKTVTIEKSSTSKNALEP